MTVETRTPSPVLIIEPEPHTCANCFWHESYPFQGMGSSSGNWCFHPANTGPIAAVSLYRVTGHADDSGTCGLWKSVEVEP